MIAALLRYTPAGARRVAFVGADEAAFAQALTRRNPKAELSKAAATLVAEDLAATPAEALAGVELVIGGLTDPAGLSTLQAAGFRLLRLRPAEGPAEVFDDAVGDLREAWGEGRLDAASGPFVVVARRSAGQPPMHLRQVSAARRLMDIRTLLPTEAMRSEPDLIVAHSLGPSDLPPLASGEAGVVIFQRPAPLSAEAYRQVLPSLADRGWLVVMEYDDHPDLVARIHGRQLDPAHWMRFSGVHGVQTTTQPLVQLFRKYNPEVRMFPNAVFELPPFAPTSARRVFYGALTRGPIAAEVAASLGPAIARFPDLSFEVVGDRQMFDALPTERKQFHDFLPYPDYLALMGTCAVSLSPLDAAEYFRTKSDAKFLDAASRGALSIVSPTVYKGVVRHGRNGLVAESLADWSPLLIRAFEDDAAREQMARNAWTYVAGERMFADQVRQRHDWYRDLWRRRDKLTAGLKARLKV